MDGSKNDSATPRTLIEGYFDKAPTQRSQIPNRKRKAIERTPENDGSKRLSQTLPSRASSTRAAKKRRSSISVATEVTPKSLMEGYLASAHSTMPSLRRLPHRTPPGKGQHGTLGTKNVIEDTTTPRTQIEGLLSSAPDEASIHAVRRNQRRRSVSINSPPITADHTINIHMSSIGADSTDSTEHKIPSSKRYRRLESLRNVNVSVTNSSLSSPQQTRKSMVDSPHSALLTSYLDDSVHSPGRVLRKTSLANGSPKRVTRSSQIFSPRRVLQKGSPAVASPRTTRSSPSSIALFDADQSVDIAMSPTRDTDLSSLSSSERVTPARRKKEEGLSKQLLREQYIQGLKDANQGVKETEEEPKTQKSKSTEQNKASMIEGRSRSAVHSTFAENLKWRTGKDPKAGKNITKGKDGFDVIEDYFTDIGSPDEESTSELDRSPEKSMSETLTNTNKSAVHSPYNTPVMTPIRASPRRKSTSVPPPTMSQRYTPQKSPVGSSPKRNSTSVPTPTMSLRSTPQKTPVGSSPKRNSTSVPSPSVSLRRTPQQSPVGSSLKRNSTSVPSPSMSLRRTPQKSPVSSSLRRNSTATSTSPGTGKRTPQKSPADISARRNSRFSPAHLDSRKSMLQKSTEHLSSRETSTRPISNMEEELGSQDGGEETLGNVSGSRLQSESQKDLQKNATSSKSLTRISNIDKSHVSVPSSVGTGRSNMHSTALQDITQRIGPNSFAPRNSIADISAIPSTGEATPDVTELDTTELFPLRTPHLGPRESNVPSPLYTSTPAPPRPNAKNKPVAVQQSKSPQTNLGLKRRPMAQVPKSQFLTNTVITQMFKHCCKMRVNKDALPEVIRVTDRYFEQVCDDLKALAKHGGRNYIGKSDCEMLMKRQGFITDKVSLNGLIEKYLPRELRQELIPIARSGNKVVP